MLNKTVTVITLVQLFTVSVTTLPTGNIPSPRPKPAGMVFVQGGSFAMGDVLGNSTQKDEKPVHKVTVSPCYRGKYEGTQAEGRRVTGKSPGKFSGDNRPVEQVSWFDAVRYCNRRSRKEGLAPCYSTDGARIVCNFKANGYRLPTEAEWEYAAKGGMKGVNKQRPYLFAGGNDVNSLAWYYGNSGFETHPVGGKSPNQLGLYDMSGNVYEWCWDWYGSYGSGDQQNPKGPASGTDRVFRGGSWFCSATSVRVSFRAHNTPAVRYDNFGFRVVRSAL